MEDAPTTSIRRELNDHGGFEAKPADRKWRFWPRTPVPVNSSAHHPTWVEIAGPTWIAARERAARHFAGLGIAVAAQDLESEPA